MDAQWCESPEIVLTIWVKNLNSIAKKMRNTKSLMIDMKPNDAIKPDIVKQANSGTYP